MSKPPTVASTLNTAIEHNSVSLTTSARPDRLRSDLFAGDRNLHLIYRGQFMLDKSILSIPGRQPAKPVSYVKKIQTALKIVIPEMDDVTNAQKEAVRNLTVNGIYEEATQGWVYIFQDLARLPQDEAAPKVGSDTILRLDLELQKIRYYSVVPQLEKTLHNASKSYNVGRFTRVSTRQQFFFRAQESELQSLSADLDSLDLPAVLRERFVAAGVDSSAVTLIGIKQPGQIWGVDFQETKQVGAEEIVAKRHYRIVRGTEKDENGQVHAGLYGYAASTWLRTEPSDGFDVVARNPETENEAFQLVFNKRVLIVQITPDGWCYVTTDDGTYGYVPMTHIWTFSEMPEPFAILYRIHSGDTLESIIEDKYGPFTAGDTDDERNRDRRFYANVILYVNNPAGLPQKERHKLNPSTGAYDEKDIVPAAIYLKQEEGGQAWDLVDIWDQIAEIRSSLSYSTHTWEATEQQMNTRYGGWHVWHQAAIVENIFLWLPSRAFADSLKAYVDTGAFAGDASQALAIKATHKWNEIKNSLDKLWPPGLGMRLDASVGATFGIPLGLDGDYNFYLWRDSDDSFKLLRRGMIGGGLDTGVGVGAYFVRGKIPNSLRSDADKQSRGLGGEMAATLRAGLQILVVQELTFPFKEDLALATLLVEVLTQVAPTSIGVLGAMLKPLCLFFNIDPMDYMTQLKLQFGIYGQVDALATAGLYYGDSNEIAAWSNSDRTTSFNKGEGHILRFLAKHLALSLKVGAEGQLATGLEYKVLNAPDGTQQPFLIDPDSGNRIPKACEIIAFMEAKFAANVELPILRSLPFPLPPSFGGGLRFNFVYHYNPEHHLPDNEDRHRFEQFRFALYQTSGELDIYEGAANEVQIRFNPVALLLAKGTPVPSLKPENIAEILSSVTPDSFDDLRIMLDHTLAKQRIGINGIIGKLKDFKSRIRPLNILLKHNASRRWGLVYGAYLDLDWALAKDEIANLAIEVYQDLVQNQGQGIEEAVVYILDYWKIGHPPKKQAALVNKFYEKLDMQNIVLHLELGAGVGAGVKAGAGGKVRIRLYGAGAAIGHLYLKFEDVQKLVAMGRRSDIKKKLLTSSQLIIDQFISE